MLFSSAFMLYGAALFFLRREYNSERLELSGRSFHRVVSGMTEQEFCKTRRWQSMRRAVLRRDRYLCVDCKRYGRLTQATTVHHIKHFDTNPELALEPSNLVSLCAGCHAKRHPEKGGRRY